MSKKTSKRPVKKPIKNPVNPVPADIYNGKAENFCNYLSTKYGRKVGKYLSDISQDLDMEIAEYNQSPISYVTMLLELIEMDEFMNSPTNGTGIEVLNNYLSKFWEIDSL